MPPFGVGPFGGGPFGGVLLGSGLSDMLNPSFEDPGAFPGQADHWTEAQAEPAGAASDIAEFQGPIREYPFENFEGSWLNNEDAVWTFPFPGGLIHAMFEGGTQEVEDFESTWCEPGVMTAPPTWNHQFRYGFTATDLLAASFDAAFTPEPREDFEEGWLANQTAVPDYSGATGSVAPFDVGVPQNFEDFEEEWMLNETAETGFPPGGAATKLAALFDAGANAFENFEGVWIETFV